MQRSVRRTGALAPLWSSKAAGHFETSEAVMNDVPGGDGFSPAAHDAGQHRHRTDVGAHTGLVLDAVLHHDDALGRRTTRVAQPLRGGLGLMSLRRQYHPIGSRDICGIGEYGQHPLVALPVLVDHDQALERRTHAQRDVVACPRQLECNETADRSGTHDDDACGG